MSGITRMERIFAAGATPMMPSSSSKPSPWPAMIDAIQVPCCPQFGLLLEVFRSVKSLPVITEPVEVAHVRVHAAVDHRDGDVGALGQLPGGPHVEHVEHPLPAGP